MYKMNTQHPCSFESHQKNLNEVSFCSFVLFAVFELNENFLLILAMSHHVHGLNFPDFLYKSFGEIREQYQFSFFVFCEQNKTTMKFLILVLTLIGKTIAASSSNDSSELIRIIILIFTLISEQHWLPPT